MKKAILIVIVFGLAIFLISQIGNLFSPGSYPYAEIYELNVNERTLIGAIDSFKKKFPAYRLPEHNTLKGGRIDSADYWYHVYFYYPEKDQIVYSWIRQKTKAKVDFAFVGINEGQNLGNRKMINKDFSESENREQIRLFEERILKILKKQLE